MIRVKLQYCQGKSEEDASLVVILPMAVFLSCFVKKAPGARTYTTHAEFLRSEFWDLMGLSSVMRDLRSFESENSKFQKINQNQT